MGKTEVTPAVFSELAKRGILLQQDKTLPSVTTLVAGEPIRGSWWGQRKSHEIFRMLEELTGHPDVLVARLIGGKVTYIHRALWRSFLAVATSRERWQFDGLSVEARHLLKKVDESRSVHAKGEPSRELQRRLLVHAAEVHTEAGRHETVLQTWAIWLKDKRVVPTGNLSEAKRHLEAAAMQIGARAETLPWRK